MLRVLNQKKIILQNIHSQEDNMLVLCNSLAKLYKIIDRIDKFEQNYQILTVFGIIGVISWRILDYKTPVNIVLDQTEKKEILNFWT